MKDKDRVLELCRRIERALQRDWGSTGTGLRQRLGSARHAVPPELRKHIDYLYRLQKQALHKERLPLRLSADFELRGDQLLDQLAQARKTAPRRLGPWLVDLIRGHRVLFVACVLTLLLAAAGVAYLVHEPAPVLPPVATPAPRPVSKPAPKPAPPPAPAPVAQAPAAAPLPAPAAPGAVGPPGPAGPPPVPAEAAEPPSLPAGTRVHIEAPSQVAITLKRAELARGATGRDEIVVIVDVQNMGYASLKRITFDATLYSTASPRPLAVITPRAADAVPWHAFLRQALRRGQGAEVRLAYSPGSPWSSDPVIELVNSGRYQLHLKAVSLADESNQSLPM